MLAAPRPARLAPVVEEVREPALEPTRLRQVAIARDHRLKACQAIAEYRATLRFEGRSLDVDPLPDPDADAAPKAGPPRCR